MSWTPPPILLAALPLLFAALCPLVGVGAPRRTFPLALVGMVGTAAVSWLLLAGGGLGGVVSYPVGGWAPPWGIEVRLDLPGLLLAAIVANVGLLILVYAGPYMAHTLASDRIPYFYALYLLAIAALQGFAISGDLFNLFLFLEIFSVTCYALVAITGEARALRASFKYLLIGAVSSVVVFLAIAFLYGAIGSLNLMDIGQRLAVTPYVEAANVAFLLFLVGFAVKAAVFPVHVWLPDAHSLAPSPVSALLSALVIKAGVLGLYRVLFTMYGQGFEATGPLLATASELFAWTAALSVVVGAVLAIRQTDLKLMIAYSSVVHIGYILLGLFLNHPRGLVGGLYSVLAHALGKAALFLAAGAFLYKTGSTRIADMKGLGRRMPLTATAFGIACLSIVGLPPSAGFVAKWHLLAACVARGHVPFLVMALVGTLLSAVYCFRVVYVLFFENVAGEAPSFDEAPRAMWIPTLALSAATLFFGVFASLLSPALMALAEQLFLR